MLDRGNFAFGYRQLTQAFGAKEDPQREDIYFEKLKGALSDTSWRRVVDRLICKSTNFPRIAEILQQPECFGGFKPEQTPAEWIVDICPVKECMGGYISVEVAGYATAYRCPKCDRWDTAAAPRYPGPVHLRTQEEIHREQEHRRGMVFDSEYREAVLGDLVKTLMGCTRKQADESQAMTAVGPF